MENCWKKMQIDENRRAASYFDISLAMGDSKDLSLRIIGFKKDVVWVKPAAPTRVIVYGRKDFQASEFSIDCFCCFTAYLPTSL